MSDCKDLTSTAALVPSWRHRCEVLDDEMVDAERVFHRCGSIAPSSTRETRVEAESQGRFAKDDSSRYIEGASALRYMSSLGPALCSAREGGRPDAIRLVTKAIRYGDFDMLSAIVFGEVRPKFGIELKSACCLCAP